MVRYVRWLGFLGFFGLLGALGEPALFGLFALFSLFAVPEKNLTSTPGAAPRWAVAIASSLSVLVAAAVFALYLR